MARLKISSSYSKPIGVAMVIQVFVVFFSGFLLDGGYCGQLCLMAMLPFWAATFLLVWRRPQQPTRFDLAFIRVGYLCVLLLTIVLAPLIWHFRGVL